MFQIKFKKEKRVQNFVIIYRPYNFYNMAKSNLVKYAIYKPFIND